MVFPWVSRFPAESGAQGAAQVAAEPAKGAAGTSRMLGAVGIRQSAGDAAETSEL